MRRGRFANNFEAADKALGQVALHAKRKAAEKEALARIRSEQAKLREWLKAIKGET